MSVNSTLIAGVGTLLLAIGVGVLIGRSANNTSAKAPPAQVVKIDTGGGSTASAATTPSESPQQSSASGSKAAKPSTAGGGTKAATKAPPLKTVTVGTPGKGPGYQNGKFTGNFFGPEAEGK
jgi:hypothetical protein